MYVILGLPKVRNASVWVSVSSYVIPSKVQLKKVINWTNIKGYQRHTRYHSPQKAFGLNLVLCKKTIPIINYSKPKHWMTATYFKWSIVLLQLFLSISVIRTLSCRAWTFSLSPFTNVVPFFFSLFILLISAIKIVIKCQLTSKTLKTYYVIDKSLT